MGGMGELEEDGDDKGKGGAEREADVEEESWGRYLESYSNNIQWQSVVRYARSTFLQSSEETPDIAGVMEHGGTRARSSAWRLAGRGQLNRTEV